MKILMKDSTRLVSR